MATVKCFTIDGVQMWIPSGDHDPPHFHARRPGEWTVKVTIQAPADADLMIAVVKPPGVRIAGKYRKAIVEGVVAHREALLAEWEACQG